MAPDKNPSATSLFCNSLTSFPLEPTVKKLVKRYLLAEATDVGAGAGAATGAAADATEPEERMADTCAIIAWLAPKACKTATTAWICSAVRAEPKYVVTGTETEDVVTCIAVDGAPIGIAEEEAVVAGADEDGAFT